MESIVIKIVDKGRPDLVARAEGELLGAGFTVAYRNDTPSLLVDARKHDDGQQPYSDAVILIGEQ